jgi:predicted exporter
MSPARRALPLIVWLTVLAVCAVVIARTRFVADLSAFMPRAPSERQQMLVDQLRDGAIARLIVAGIEGGSPEERARQSRALAQALSAQPDHISGVQNGDAESLERDRRYFFEHRYLLSPSVTPERFQTEGLQQAIGGTLEQLAGQGGLMLKQLLTQDPTGETLELLRLFDGGEQPANTAGVWSTRDGQRALLLLQTRAEGSDIDAQAATIAAVRSAYTSIAGPQAQTRLLLTGAGVFSVASRTRIESEVHLLAGASLILVVSLLLLVYRSPRLLVLSLLPVLTGALVGIASVSLVHGQVHGLTLAFGTTLIGEAVDYAIYLFIQRPQGQGARLFWRTLWLGTLTSIAGFGVLLGSGFPGLAQLGLYSSCGLLAAVWVTRHVLSRLTPETLTVRELPRVGAWLMRAMQQAPRLRGPLLAMMVAVLVVVLSHHDRIWNRTLSALNPVSKAELQLDEDLRRDLGGPDMRYLVVLTAADEESALQEAERAGAALQKLVDEGALATFQSPAKVLPSLATQHARQASLPKPAALRQSLRAALRELPLRSEKLGSFVADVERARTQPLLTRADLQGSSLGLLVDTLMVPRTQGRLVLMPLQAIDPKRDDALDVARLDAALAAAGSTAHAIDLYTETHSLFDSYLHEALVSSALGCLSVLALLCLALRSVRRSLRVALPLACAVFTVVAVMLLAGLTLTIMHLIGLLLVVAIGSNYALFFDQSHTDNAPPTAEATTRATAVSLVVANLTTVGSFGMLGLSSVPVLSHLGTTVGLGACLSLIYAAVLTPRKETRSARR